jgi:hypothetical protein
LISAKPCFPAGAPSSTKPNSFRLSCGLVDEEENKLATREARDMALPQFPIESPSGLPHGNLLEVFEGAVVGIARFFKLIGTKSSRDLRIIS